MKINSQKLEKIIKNFDNKRILIIGDLMLDEYIFGGTTRLSPEAPVPIVEVERIDYVPGGAANAASNVRNLGDQTILAGVVGDDENARTLIKLLKKNGIKTNGILKDPNRPTTLKTRIVSQGQHVVRIDKESSQPISKILEEKLLTFVKKVLKSVDIVLISDYAKGVVTPTISRAIINLAKKRNKKVLVDPKGEDFSKYKGCFIVTPNLKETEAALKIQVKDLKSLPQAAKTLLTQVNSKGVLVTLGTDGMALLERTGKYTAIPSAEVKVVDISGAGDTAMATFALSLAAGANFEEAMLISTYACSVVIGKIGTATTSRNELIKAIKEVALKE